MLDDFRNTSEQPDYQEPVPPAAMPAYQEEKPAQSRFLGMTPFQRFIIVFLLFMLTCVLGSFCLLITEKIIPPFF
ncbi:hypothetical protein [Leptolinea tardivitalis]|uniref:Uncharacterized protein n=1 Tax=Leptolinea tardivitalis TaxID=229920 RepID=A0A0P6WXI1_9CHLR|nr:hypothetical protein [Leptolinea tardivitalis]KPL70980.1 hypothetical protein ADM99_11790 [Leptolinea tardivitalis]GAP22370.1 hypothetical protein LTAR_02601 [Leptolinea tardivitalis]